MQYLSTRGGVSSIGFTEAVMMGLADDGGLLLPRAIPRIDTETFESWRKHSYQDLAFEVMSRFIDDIPAADLKNLIQKSYTAFSHTAITPLVHLDDLHILELFHGPTLAFKDIALQFLGNLFEYLLERDDRVMNIIGATSGDTGSAAIYGIRGKRRMNIFILHPHKRISPVQEKQMTTVLDANVYNIAIDGTFDDAQAIIKNIFTDTEFKSNMQLGAINSINWARVLAQVVYYIHSCLHITAHEDVRSCAFSVPTGNFGDIFAGYIAKKMLPEGIINKLILATNENDILCRFVSSGDYSLAKVRQTTSPSMDIQAASNFERYLYYLYDEEPSRVKEAMKRFHQEGRLDLNGYLEHIRRDFLAASVSEKEVLETIALFFSKHDYTLDPHTAVGVRAALNVRKQGVPVVCLATAHPAKFGSTVEKAINSPVKLPPALAAIMTKDSRCEFMKANTRKIMAYLEEHGISRQ
ncbi:MAG: threonine synthase [Desulfocapsaceae bacterium]|jgi:threonine synthase|nr:threonine synthase [Desulfocapsaceae bacterium]